MPSTKKVVYKTDSGDLRDEEIAKYMNIIKGPILLRMICECLFMLSTKKVCVKITNDRLMIIVGGDYI